MATPEQKSRELIDAQLRDAGWIIQDREDMSLGAGLGVAVREYSLATGHAIICCSWTARLAELSKQSLKA